LILFFHLIQGMTLGLYATVLPGPFQAFLLSHSLKNGWKKTLPAAFAPLITDGPILAGFLFILTQVPPWLLEVLRMAGGLFILYLAGGIYRTFRQPHSRLEPDAKAGRKGLLNAVAINLLNPNPYIFWSLVGGPIVLAGWREAPVLGVAFLAGFFGTFICSVALLIILFATAGGLDPKLHRILSVLSFSALIAFGFYQIIAGAVSLL
jgi:threonine/homoserine/homoserine lactone efflux protein